MIGIKDDEFESIRKEDFYLEDTKPLSPLPLLEELIGAIFCAAGEYKCFPFKGKIYTFVDGRIKTVKEKNELLLSRTTVKRKEVTEEVCRLNCQYNGNGKCNYNPLDVGETGCEDPYIENLKLNAQSYEDLL